MMVNENIKFLKSDGMKQQVCKKATYMKNPKVWKSSANLSFPR